MVMEYIPGQTLLEKVGQKMDWQDAANLLLPVAEALEYAHEHNVIHRDLKPSNILLNSENQPILSDFSIARIIEEEETREMTGTNVGLGSPFYMSPEQGTGMPTDYRADIYALGIIFFELVTGQKPFDAEVGMEVVIQQVTMQPPNPRVIVPELPEPIEKIILTSLKKDPDERFQSMAEWIEAVQQVKQSGKYKAIRRNKGISRTTAFGILGGTILFIMALVALWVSGVIPELQRAFIPTPISQVLEQKVLTTRTVSAVPITTPTLKTVVAAATKIVRPPTFTPAPTRYFEPTAIPMQYKFGVYPILESAKFPTLNQAIAPENIAQLQEVERFGNSIINDVAWTQQDDYLIAGTSSGVYFYDLNKLVAKYFFDAKGWVSVISQSSDGKEVATGYPDGMVRVWNAQTGSLKFELTGHKGSITSLAFSPDGKNLISGSSDLTAHIWDLDQGEDRFTLARHGMIINDVAFTPDGSTAITTSEDFQTILWDISSGKVTGTFHSAARVLDMALSNNGETLALALNNSKVEVWNLRSQKLLRTLNDPNQVTPVLSLSFSPNNQLLATASADSLIRIWNVASGDMLYTLDGAANPGSPDKDLDQLIALAYSREGTRLVSLSKGGYMVVWNMYSRSRMSERDMKRSEVNRIILAPDNKNMVFQNGNQQVTIWSIPENKQLAEYNGQMPRGNIISYDSRWVVLT